MSDWWPAVSRARRRKPYAEGAEDGATIGRSAELRNVGGTWVCEGEKDLAFELEGLRELLSCLTSALHFNCANPWRCREE